MLRDRRHRVRVVGGELRVQQSLAFVEDVARARQVRDVGVGLARVQRITRQAALLAALDLGVPVGALDQAHVQHAAASRAQGRRCTAAWAARASGRSAPRCRSRSSRRAHGSRQTASSCSIVSSSRSDSSVSSVSAMPASRARRHSSTRRGVSSRCTRWRCARSKRGCIAESFTEMLGRDSKSGYSSTRAASAPMAVR